MHPCVVATYEALISLPLDRWSPETYKNRRGDSGLWVKFWSIGQWHTLSVSRLSGFWDPRQIARSIEGIETIDRPKRGFYANRSGVLGFYATAQSSYTPDGSTSHWYMIARSHEMGSTPQRTQSSAADDPDLAEYIKKLDLDPRFR